MNWSCEKVWQWVTSSLRIMRILLWSTGQHVTSCGKFSCHAIRVYGQWISCVLGSWRLWIQMQAGRRHWLGFSCYIMRGSGWSCGTSSWTCKPAVRLARTRTWAAFGDYFPYSCLHIFQVNVLTTTWDRRIQEGRAWVSEKRDLCRHFACMSWLHCVSVKQATSLLTKSYILADSPHWVITKRMHYISVPLLRKPWRVSLLLLKSWRPCKSLQREAVSLRKQYLS